MADQIQGLQDNPGSETLTSLKAVGQGSVEEMPCDTPIFQDWADNGKIQDATGANRSTREGPMDKTNVRRAFYIECLVLNVYMFWKSKISRQIYCQ